MKNTMLYYSVGALLYSPANNTGIFESLRNEKFGTQFSLALCLEDTIQDNSLEDAENILIHTLQQLKEATAMEAFYLPKIFIRVRTPQQIPDLYERLSDAAELVTGFIAPKFSPANADAYIEALLSANRICGRKIYLMPIFEDTSIISLRDRCTILYELKAKLDSIEELVLNIRVGGNDLCHAFGFRRHVDESIHSIRPIANIFADIITVFGMDYVISGPVWEYYNGEGWQEGLRAELKEDLLCGFIGKTVIHPNQIALINEACRVSRKDYNDACSILNWDASSPSLVAGSTSKERMNEYKTHFNWANKIMMLSEIYGIQ